MKKTISVIGPLHNESSNVDEFAERVMQSISKTNYDLELILIDDGSVDLTWDCMLSLKRRFDRQISLVKLEKNSGLENALKAGFQSVTKGDAIIVMDADLQDPPEVILDLIFEWEKGAKIVHAIRTTRKSDSLVKKSTAKLYYKLQSRILGRTSQFENAGNFKLLDRRAFDRYLNSILYKGVFRTSVPYLNFDTAAVYYARDSRKAGNTSFNFSKLFSFAAQALTSQSTKPLRLSLYIYLLTLSICGAFAGLFIHLFDNGKWITIIGYLFLCSTLNLLLFVLMFFYVSNIYSRLSLENQFEIAEYHPLDEFSEKSL